MGRNRPRRTEFRKKFRSWVNFIFSKISSLKASLVEPDDLLSNEESYGFDEKFARVYVRYQDELKKNNALDFDDLIMLSVKLFEKPGTPHHTHISKSVLLIYINAEKISTHYPDSVPKVWLMHFDAGFFAEQRYRRIDDPFHARLGKAE